MQDVNGKHLLKVEPLNAILDPHYFVRAVHQCTMSVLHGRDADAMQHASENAGYGYASIMPAAVKFRHMCIADPLPMKLSCNRDCQTACPLPR